MTVLLPLASHTQTAIVHLPSLSAAAPTDVQSLKSSYSVSELRDLCPFLLQAAHHIELH